MGCTNRYGARARVISAIIGVCVMLLAANATGDVGQDFGFDDYARVLGAHVDEHGMLEYKRLKAHRQGLDTFAGAIAALEPEAYGRWTDDQKIAFWINAYNALTLKAIIDNYPIKASFFKSRLYPKNSIRQIPGVWDELEFPVIRRQVTLNQIEHVNLRRNFDEPRIHVALVCAAMGCPPLRNEPFTGERLDAQLDDQTRRFLKNAAKFRIDRDAGRVYLSSIFKWFGKDFIESYGTEDKSGGHSDAQRAVLNFVGKYLDGKDAEYLFTGEYDIIYLDYDWSLNEQAGE
ncbi:MAG: DUF547 domain-containing protein [Candidatus Hydrogenedentota bacterium]|nr:MAG: DUF547 domain-containing protein [Candidatus Hydrogenedentota bacterium]